jgi:hypothetical protein
MQPKICIFVDVMKKVIRISFMALATFMLVMLAVVPHHHHQGLWCNIVEQCALDHDDNDRHTHHHDDNTSCVEHLNYVVSKHSVAQNNIELQQAQFIAIAAIIAQCLAPDDSKEPACDYRPESLFTGIDVSNRHALRAPPVA